MTTRHAIEIETLSLAIVAAFLGTFFAMYSNHTPKKSFVYSLPVVENLQPSPTAIPTPPVASFSQPSPDGSKEVTMKVRTNSDATRTYIFTITDTTTQTTIPLYTTTFATDSMSLPFNAFSPDNRYLFLNHNTKTGTEAWVFRADANPIAENVTYYNAKEIFDARNTGNTYQEATGWASETLVIINTTLSDGSKGPSYWLEIPSKAVIQLSTEF